MMQQPIVHIITIDRPAQVHYFQVNLPPDVVRVIAAQIGLRITGPAKPTTRPWEMGALTLQTEGKMNFCYNQMVLGEPAEAVAQDLGFRVLQAGFLQSTVLMKNGIAVRSQHVPDPVDFPNGRTLYGVYKDMLAPWPNGILYVVTLTLWTQLTKMGTI
jgi:hypothetical protein